MAPVRNPNAPALVINMRGANTKRAALTIYQSDYTLINWGAGEAGDPLYDLFVTVRPLVEALSMAIVTDYKYLISYQEGAAGAPPLDANVNDLGIFKFLAQDGSTVFAQIPAIDPAVLVPAGDGMAAVGTTSVARSAARQLINTSDDDVIAFVNFMLTGAEGFIPGGNRILPGGNAPLLVALTEAYAEQRPSDMVNNRQGI